jgi:hypothetical protein
VIKRGEPLHADRTKWIANHERSDALPGLRVFVIESVTLDAYSGKPEWARNLETAGQVGAEIERAVTTQVRKVRLPVWIILAAYLLYTKTAQELPSPKGKPPRGRTHKMAVPLSFFNSPAKHIAYRYNIHPLSRCCTADRTGVP